METDLTIPEYVGWNLTNGAFLDYAAATRDAYVGIGLEGTIGESGGDLLIA